MKRNILKGAFWVLLSISTVSCSDFLDINPHDSISDAAVWENMDLAEAFLNNCYTYVEGENENGVPFCSYTDELFHRTGYATEVYTLGNVSCDNYNVGFSEARGNTWNFYYSGIKKVKIRYLLFPIVKRPEKQKLSGRLIFYVLFSIISFTHFTGAFLW